MYPYSNKGYYGFTRIRRERKGRAIMNNMANVYRHYLSGELTILRSKKIVRLQKLEALPKTYFVKLEIEALEHQIHQIEVELTARFYQMPLPLE